MEVKHDFRKMVEVKDDFHVTQKKTDSPERPSVIVF